MMNEAVVRFAYAYRKPARKIAGWPTYVQVATAQQSNFPQKISILFSQYNATANWRGHRVRFGRLLSVLR